MSSLSTHFRGSANKHLSSVDVPSGSNQHEIGSNKFTEILGIPGDEKRRFRATFLYFDPDTDDVETCADTVTYYNTRSGKPRAPEYRLYYPSNEVSDLISEGDLCLVAVRTNGDLLIAFARAGSTHERRLHYLFGISETNDWWRIDDRPSEAELDFAAASILEALGIEVFEAANTLLGSIVDRFGMTFPPTAKFSAFAREICPVSVSPTDAPDAAIEEWMQHEERLFRALEKAIVETKLSAGFSDVDDFVSFSLSVQNRRKARAGHALENHLEAIFRANKIRYDRGKFTEGRSRPDFLFPGQKEYLDGNIASPPLRMLAAKATCKDRWRQILAEAARIPEKHLFTLETAISTAQTTEMQTHRVKLIVPPSVAATYTPPQREWLLSLGQFVDLISD